MYAGHAAVALLVKGLRPRIPLAVLVPVAFAPDILEWIAVFSTGGAAPYRMLTHSLVSVAIGATVAALAYWAVCRAPGDALAVGLTYAAHWPADFITGIKPTWPGGPDVGLLLYHRPAADVVVETLVIIVCWLVYRRSLPPAGRRRVVGLLIPLGLIGMQVGFTALQYPLIKDPLREMTTRLYP